MKTYPIAKELSPQEKLYTISPEETLTEALARMQERSIHHLLVTDQGQLKGMVSDRDLYAAAQSHHPLTIDPNRRIHDFMRVDVPTLDENSELGDAISLMREKNLSALPLLKEGQLHGILTETDLLRIMEKTLKYEIEDLSVTDKSQIYLANPMVQKVMKLLAELGF